MNLETWQHWFVKLVYADHNSTSQVRQAIAKTVSHLGPDDIGLNVGAGKTRIHPQIQNMDIFAGESIDLIGRAEAIPAEDNYFTVIITQEVLEHVEHPFVAASEMHRVLKPGGLLYCQLPFIIGYHPGPTDFWRFTREGISSMLREAGFQIEEQGITVGSGTGFYRILVEFMAISCALIAPPLYKAFKAIFALLLFPIKWLDHLFKYSREKDRIAGGYYVIARKR
ncbi:MAG: methyltransferase domain-containing protein [Planctomycetaceae bacterium]